MICFYAVNNLLYNAMFADLIHIHDAAAQAVFPRNTKLC